MRKTTYFCQDQQRDLPSILTAKSPVERLQGRAFAADFAGAGIAWCHAELDRGGDAVDILKVLWAGQIQAAANFCATVVGPEADQLTAELLRRMFDQIFVEHVAFARRHLKDDDPINLQGSGPAPIQTREG